MNEVQITHEGKEKTPAYIWETGRTFYLSKRERVVAECWLRTRNLVECVRVMKEEGLREVSSKTVKRWLERDHVVEWLKEQMEERGIAAGWTRERWLKVMTDHIRGVKRLMGGDLYGMKLVAEVCGFDVGEPMKIINQINFTQLNGRA